MEKFADLNDLEKESIEGGVLPWFWSAILGSLIYDIVSDPVGSWEAFSGSWTTYSGGTLPEVTIKP
ncbi:MAG: hypothetical protein IPP04_15705 [Saprospiraceae bacterium]|nr:hypothetical protein [Saprospiraceae bacterium]MBK9931301.1 hypothetical protein [Saprospiraceae bacterium]MBL0111311.1 hypothetical protein [Saprospiraceae bacterium]